VNNIAIEFKNVSKRYKVYKNNRDKLKAVFLKNVKYFTKKALNDVSFTIEKGETVALFGRNGAGKSTILKMITGVSFPSDGKIDVNGRVSALLELQAGFAPEFTGRENIYFKGQLMGLKEAEVKRLEPEIIEFAELGDYIDQPVRTYSSGMKAKLGFAINSNIEPEILIVDEALSVGDKNFRKKCNAKVNELVGEKQVTFLFVTHSTKVAKNFCKRGIVMKDGSLKFDGDIDEAIRFYEEMIQKEMAKNKAASSPKASN